MYAQPARSGAGATAAIHGAGFSLLEVLIALAVLAVGLAGLATLMLSAVGTTADAEHASMAAELVMARVHELRMSPTVEPLALEALAPEAFTAREHAAWLHAVAVALPGGAGRVCRDATPDDGAPGDLACDGGGNPVIKVAWRGHSLAGPGTRVLFHEIVP